MKYLLLLALFTIAFCNSSFRPNGMQDIEELTNLDDHRPIDDLRYFFLTLYDQFNLTEPEEIVSCFNNKTARLFFDVLYEFHQVLNDTKERHQFKLHLDWAKLHFLSHGLKDSLECLTRTKDFKSLLNALEVEETDPESIGVAHYIYYQARYSALLNDFVPLIKGLDAKNNRKAGIAYSHLLSNMVETFKYRGLFYLMNQAFANGVAIHLGLRNPSDSIRCGNNEEAAAYLEFFLKWSEVVSNGKWSESAINTRFWWRDFGKDIMKRIPEEVFECISKSEDNQELVEKLGVDIYSKEFVDSMLRYISTNRFEYFMMMKAMKHSFDNYNFNHAGAVYGRFIKRIANFQPDGTEEMKDVDI